MQELGLTQNATREDTRYTPLALYGLSRRRGAAERADRMVSVILLVLGFGGPPGFWDSGAPRDLAAVTVFHDGLAGVHNYRIPAIVQTASALVALAEARDGGDNSASRIAVRVSHDDGLTWSPNVTFAAGSIDSPTARAACAAGRTSCRVGNPAAVFDEVRQRVVLLHVLRGFGAGEDAVGTGLVTSTDGVHWDAPVDVSESFGAAAGAMPGPGTALQLAAGGEAAGRLLVASHQGAYTRDYVTLSDDGGVSWRTAARAFAGMDEAALTQLPNGSVLLNMRHKQSPSRGRAVAVSHDGGVTFGPLSYDAALVSPVCQASIVSFGNATYFSNPASTSGRSHLSIRKSTNSAASWASQLLVQAAASAGYSCLVKGALRGHADSGGLLYEAADGTIKFARFPLSLG